MDRRLPSSFGAAPRLSASSSSSSSTPASASQPLRRPSISTSTSASYAHVAPTPSRSTLDRRPSASSLGGGVGSSGSAIPRPGAAAVPATPSSRIPFGSKRPLSSTGPSSTDEPPSTLRRTNPSSAVQADLERRLAASAERVRELERVREEGQREVDEVRNMMRLLVADDEGRAREAQEAAERQADELAKARQQIHALRSSLSTSEAHAGSLSSDLANLHVSLSRAQSAFDLSLAELSNQAEAADEDASRARERAERAEAEAESLKRRVGELGVEVEGARRGEGEREGAGVMREELKRQSSLLASQDAQLTLARSELSALRAKRSDQSARVAALEGELEGLRTRVGEAEQGSGRWALEEELERVRAEVGEREREVETLRKELASSSNLGAEHATLSSSLASLTTSLASLEAENDLLQRRVAIGEYDPATFRCLQLALNPSTVDLAVRTETLDALRRENGALLDQLKREGNGGPAGGEEGGEGVVPRETYERVLKERADERAQMDKRLLRLKEVFKAKSQEFLDTLHSLLGYRILFSDSGDVRLNTTYAPRGKSGVTFRFASQEGHFGSMAVTGGLAKTLDELREFWVTQRQEVPCFLASVTLELYDRSTRGKAAGWVRPMDDEDE